LYEQLLTSDLQQGIGQLKAVVSEVDETDAPDLLGEFVGRQVTTALRSMKPEQRVEAVNRLLQGLTSDVVEPGPQQLLALAREQPPGVWTLLQVRPAVPLSRPALLTNGPSDPKLGAELRAELGSADRVDLLCAFVKWYGLRVLEVELRALRERGVALRVLTTTYMGATDRRALDRLVREFGAEVRVNYETQSTRLHAKAWLFRRSSGYDTAYVGSSNLSRAALLDGLEWNVKLAGSHTPELLAKFEATFDSYWEDPSFIRYDPDTDAERLDEALAVAAGRQDRGTITFATSGLEVRAYPHQQEILERLAVEREVHDRQAPRRPPQPAVHRAPRGDPATVPTHLPRGPRRRLLRRALRRRQPTRAVAARLCEHPELVVIRRAPTARGAFRGGRHRRVPPRRGLDVPAAAGAPESEGAPRAHRHA
jgi:HKD family nuclease